MNPTFLQIWSQSGWADFWFVNHGRSKSRTYFQVRSAIRTAIWLPITVYIFVNLAEGLWN